ncbi:MAG: diaminopimelate decarboxylase [Bacteroidota bacterium]
MDFFEYRAGELYCESVSVSQLGQQVPTPFYLYSLQTFRRQFLQIRDLFRALDPTICFSVKSCNNIHLIREIATLGAGMDIVSGGELFLLKQVVELDRKKVVYAGVGKTRAELIDAIRSGIGYINVESVAELELIRDLCAELEREVRVLLRFLPEIYDKKTNKKTRTGGKGAKFGIPMEAIIPLVRRFQTEKRVRIAGLHCHIGSPISSPKYYVMAIRKMLAIIDELGAEGIRLPVLNLGGGFPADYDENTPTDLQRFADAIIPELRQRVERDGMRVILEPGRAISANAGIMVTKVLYRKRANQRNILIVDAGMSQFIRPTLYNAFHYIWPVDCGLAYQLDRRIHPPVFDGLSKCDIAGPICESSDFLARGRAIPPVREEDLLAVFTVGAYGMVMASNYNAVRRPAELLVDGERVFVIRERENYERLAQEMVKSELSLLRTV